MAWTPSNCPCNPDKGKMQAITAILNPNTVGRGEGTEEEMMLFQSLPNKSLGYDQFEVDDSNKIKPQQEGGVNGYYDHKVKVPTLKFQSKLISLKVDNIINVYGVLEDGQVCLMSPVFMPIPDLFSVNGIIAGCSNGEHEIWLYYQENGKIMERSLVNLEARANPVVESGAKESTDIVAFWDGSQRWIAYQENGYKVKVRCLDTTVENAIRDSNKITGGYTKLAAVQTPVADGHRIYLYMTTNEFELYRAHADTSKGVVFNQPIALQTNVSVADYTWFDVEPDEEKKKNLIYTIAKNDSKIKCVRDSWAA